MVNIVTFSFQEISGDTPGLAGISRDQSKQ
jgi:hypothetical protein